MSERLSDERVAAYANRHVDPPHNVCGYTIDDEATVLAREVRDRREAEKRDAAWVALAKATLAKDEFGRSQRNDPRPYEVWRADFDELVAAYYTALAAVRGAAKEEGGDASLCDDCGHPEDWHTGSFTACNHPAHGCHCDGYEAPSEKAGGS